MNKAKGRQHSHYAARRKAMRDTRARRKLERKRKRDAKVFANKAAGKPRKVSPSDARRAAARKLGNISARKHIPRLTAEQRAANAAARLKKFVAATAIIAGS